jgi:hypothetical protein
VPARSIVEQYLVDKLAPRLRGCGMPEHAVGPVLDDVRARLRSLLRRWADAEFRRTVLLPAREEAAFWKPLDADLDVRCLIVLAVRNSRIEDLSSTPEAAARWGAAGTIPDTVIPEFTREAIQHFARLDLATVGRALGDVDAGDSDPFGPLPTRYPATWAAFRTVSEARGAATFPSVVTTAPPLLDGLPPAQSRPFGEADVRSGMDTAITPGLQHVLEAARDHNDFILFFDCFKYLSRNPELLYPVLEFAFAHGRGVVTHNYYLSNGYVAARKKLIRPAHRNSEIYRKLQFRHDGTVRRHAEALTLLHTQYLRSRLPGPMA